MCQAVFSPNLTKKFQWEVSQIADNRFPCVTLLGGLSVNLNHLKMTHSSYREYIARYLLTTSLKMANCTKKKIPVPIDNTPLRLLGRHFITKFDFVPGSKHKYPARKCRVCNFTPEQLADHGHKGLKLPSKYSSYCCRQCGGITLCITPCFEVFHCTRLQICSIEP